MRLWPWTRKPQPSPTKQSAGQAEQDYERYNAYSQLLDRNGQWISVADTKAGAILAFLVVIFPIFAPSAFSAMRKAMNAIPRQAIFWEYLPIAGIALLLAVFFMAVLLTLFRVLMALIPRLTRQGKSGLIFFGDIAALEYDQWLHRMLTLDPQTLTSQILEQVYTTACIASRKHKYVSQAILTLVIVVFLGFALYMLNQFMR